MHFPSLLAIATLVVAIFSAVSQVVAPAHAEDLQVDAIACTASAPIHTDIELEGD